MVRISPSMFGWNWGNTLAVLTPKRVETTSARTER